MDWKKMDFRRRIERERISETEPGGRGPIRRRIDSLTIKLQPFENMLTNEEAITVRNVIESLLQDYFFEVQPWVVRNQAENSFNEDSSDTIEDGIAGPADRTTGPSGSVTYVGLAQILENKQSEDRTGVEVTVNGLVYFAEGSENIPDENELLQTMEEKALGDTQAVVNALRDFFPAQQNLIVTIETPIKPTLAPVASPSVEDLTPEFELVPSDITEAPAAMESIETQPPTKEFNDNGFYTDPEVVVGAANKNQSVGGGSSKKSMVLGGGLGIGLLVIGTMLGLFMVQRRRKRAISYRANRAKGTGDDDEYLVDTGDLALSLSKEHWKLNSNNTTDSDEDPEVGKNGTAEKPIPAPFPVVIPTEAPESSSAQSNTKTSYLSSIFQRKSPIVEQHLEFPSSVSSNEEGKHPKREGSATSLSNYQFTDDGSSDFSDVVSIQPQVVTLKSLESFEEQHTSMTRQEYIVQKDQLGSSFEEPPISILGEMGATRGIQAPTNNPTSVSAGSRDSLSYSSSSLSSREPQHQQLQQPAQGAALILNDLERAAEKEDQRIRYSMMPNPYVRRRQGGGDRSAPCVLKATEITAASLARASHINNGNEASILSSESSSDDETGNENSSPSSITSGMIPKIAAPSWWSSSPETGGDEIKNKSSGSDRPRRRSSAAVEEAFREEDAYSGDEENTFGAAESDGWDPTDAALSSMGDAPTEEEIKMVEFQVGKLIEPPSPPGEKTFSRARVPSPSSRTNIEVAKSVLQRVKASSPEMEKSDHAHPHKLGESITSVRGDDASEEIHFDSSTAI